MDSDREFWITVAVFVVLAGLVSWAAFTDGRTLQLRYSRQEAVDAGAAEWVATQDGKLEFKYIQCGETN